MHLLQKRAGAPHDRPGSATFPPRIANGPCLPAPTCEVPALDNLRHARGIWLGHPLETSFRWDLDWPIIKIRFNGRASNRMAASSALTLMPFLSRQFLEADGIG